ncbi:hypothetical protein [Methylobacterium dankookense]|uniref:Uncharacterized protein n=1 Tax=Methylobacterium dankookense TaxID=560405 RepID=A0A564FXS7_9HYPH|nr:hypothetical protein [Methylobacterium dankookense]GJD54284.1 hypothetical protein IFDJLNFL_0152 [Methylobacterium dankookense]VUF12979.1 hypothetical protein MTDSW087_02674 [Methylobacterium dankookense]
MRTSTKNPAADRHQGGPGSSHQNAAKPGRPDDRGPAPGSPTSDSRSHVSGGGGERDRHHRHSGTGHAPDRADRSH